MYIYKVTLESEKTYLYVCVKHTLCLCKIFVKITILIRSCKFWELKSDT